MSGKVKPKQVEVRRIGHSLQEFREMYDKDVIVPKKVREALKKLGNRWIPEAEFIRMAMISQADMGNYREQFAEHIVMVDSVKRVWVGTRALAAELRGSVK